MSPFLFTVPGSGGDLVHEELLRLEAALDR
jgi:hypothetical protein